MIKALLVLVTRNVTFFEIVGAGLVIGALSVRFGLFGGLLSSGVAALLKSLELDLSSSGDT